MEDEKLEERIQGAIDPLFEHPLMQKLMKGYGPGPHSIRTLAPAGCERFLSIIQVAIDKLNRATRAVDESWALRGIDIEQARVELDEALRALRDGYAEGRGSSLLYSIGAALSDRSPTAYRAFNRAARRLQYRACRPDYPEALERLATACFAAIVAETRVAAITNDLSMGRDRCQHEDPRRPSEIPNQ